MMIEAKYRKLSLVQSISIAISALSVFDLGISGSIPRGIWINYLLFHVDSYPVYISKNPFWGEFQFWGYCFIIVSTCQFLKVYNIEYGKFQKFGNFNGILAYFGFVILHLLALIVVLNEFDFQNHAFSSLVEYGMLPRFLTVLAMIIPGLTFPIYIGIVCYDREPALFRVIVILTSIFSGMMMLSVGATAITNEPVDHGVFVRPLFSSLTMLIIFISFNQLNTAKRTRIISYFGLFFVLNYLLFLIFSPGTIIFQQFIIGGLYSNWFLAFGIDLHFNEKIHKNA